MADVTSRSRRVLDRIQQQGETARGSTESAAGQTPVNLATDPIESIVDRTCRQLRDHVRDWLGNDPNALAVVQEIEDSGREGLRLSREAPSRLTGNESALGGLEAIVDTTGARPSFLVRDDEVLVGSSWSPVGDWPEVIQEYTSELSAALQAVGRIDVDTGNSQPLAIGTGFLVQENLLMTNRHVLQTLAEQVGPFWRFTQSAWVDFGQEQGGRGELRKRRIRGVVFAGAHEIATHSVDHRRLDLALLELDPPTADTAPPSILRIDTDSARIRHANEVFVAGYPIEATGQDLADRPLLDRLFANHFGKKRMSPGSCLTGPGPGPTTVRHDATTLVGSSGSVIIGITDLGAAAAIHYGGDSLVENWGHVLGEVLDLVGTGRRTLRQVCVDAGVNLD